MVGTFVRNTATISINANLMFRAQTRFKGEPESTDRKLFQAAGLVGIARFPDNLRKLKCSEATVANTTHIFSQGT